MNADKDIYEFANSDGCPLWPRREYELWLKEKAGTPEQRKRYQAALDWYDAHPETKKVAK